VLYSHDLSLIFKRVRVYYEIDCTLSVRRMYTTTFLHTIQRIRLGANNDGRLTAISHDVVEQTSTLKVFLKKD